MAKITCHVCKRTVVMVRVGEGLVATDPELINVVPARHVMGDAGGGIRMGTSTTPARRLHEERCSGYAEQSRRDRLRSEMLQFNAQNGAMPPTRAVRAGRASRKNRGL